MIQRIILMDTDGTLSVVLDHERTVAKELGLAESRPAGRRIPDRRWEPAMSGAETSF
jgi:hypothetical protein